MNETHPSIRKYAGLAAEISGYGVIGAGGGGMIITLAKHEEIQGPKEENMARMFGLEISLIIIGAILASKFRVSRGPSPKR